MMTDFSSYLHAPLIHFFKKHQHHLSDLAKANALLQEHCGVHHFFSTSSELKALLRPLDHNPKLLPHDHRRAYGDFQTPGELASKVAQYAFAKDPNIEFVLEPTCGKGSFILAVLQQFKGIKKIVGIEIYKPYLWETKFKILDYFLRHPKLSKPAIELIHANAFSFPYEELTQSTPALRTLIIGNPPWVTNTELSLLDSDNLPPKSNFKQHKGLEAMTGKGNFDIGEYITSTLIRCFQQQHGQLAFLVKNAVIKNLIEDQQRNAYTIGNLTQLNIDAKQEFDASVNAALFSAELNHPPALICQEMNFYSQATIRTFGWYQDQWVASIKDYDQVSHIDGQSSWVWRSGIKHDCSKVMELKAVEDHYMNGWKHEVQLEDGLVYGLMKSADLKGGETTHHRKKTIVTQQKIGQDTAYIEQQYPLTYDYLIAHKANFEKRKSSIYRGKPPFSIFGVGPYSFAPYKIAISGLYKTTHFTLVKPHQGKPVVLDDTCYFIGFEQLKRARIAHYLLNSSPVQQFLKSIIFSDAKRPVNKATLMRINLQVVYMQTDFQIVKQALKGISLADWKSFKESWSAHPQLETSK